MAGSTINHGTGCGLESSDSMATIVSFKTPATFI